MDSTRRMDPVPVEMVLSEVYYRFGTRVFSES